MLTISYKIAYLKIEILFQNLKEMENENLLLKLITDLKGYYLFQNSKFKVTLN